MTLVERPLDAHRRFDLSDLVDSKIGVECIVEDIAATGTIKITRFGDFVRVGADDAGLVIVVKWPDGETEAVRPSNITYINGRYLP